MLKHASGHGLIANEKAMTLAGINRETPDPIGGKIVRDAAGNAIGVFEERAQNIIVDAYYTYRNSLSEEDRLKEWLTSIQFAENECLQKGVTSFQDAGSKLFEIDRYANMGEEGMLNLRLWAMIREPSAVLNGRVGKYRMIDVENGFFTCRALKVSIDGALGSFGAWMLQPYNDEPDFYGQNTTTVEEVRELAKIAIESNMQLCVHAIGDRANRESLNIFENVFQEYNKSDLRWRIEHAQHLSPADIPRFFELGVIASMQGIHCTSDAPYVVKRLGEKRAKEGAYNWRALIDSGALVTNGTDTPVEDVNPFLNIYASVTRKRADNGKEFFVKNAMTRTEAIFSYTMANATAAFEEDQKGSIEVGKYADLVMLSNNLMSCTEKEILETKVLCTIVNGEIKYGSIEI